MALEGRIDKRETITETLAAGMIDVANATELGEEADDHLRALREELDVGGGENIEVDTE